MNVALWILQGVLGAMVARAGVMPSTRPQAALVRNLPWVEDVAPAVVRVIGAAELLGALGLVVPASTGVATSLTPLAATGVRAAANGVDRMQLALRRRGNRRLGATRRGHPAPQITEPR